MNRMIVKSRVGADGVLHIDVPVGLADANREVQLTIEPVGPCTAIGLEYRDWLDRIAGTWQGDIERPQHGNSKSVSRFHDASA